MRNSYENLKDLFVFFLLKFKIEKFKTFIWQVSIETVSLNQLMNILH